MIPEPLTDTQTQTHNRFIDAIDSIMKRMGVEVMKNAGRAMNEGVSFIVFCILDLLDFLLCVVFKVVDFFIEAEWKPCYCSSPKEGGNILVSEQGESKILSLTSSSSSKLLLEDISLTLFSRPSLVSRLKRLHCSQKQSTSLTVNSTIVEMLQGKINGTTQHQNHPITPRWSDCDCKLCTHWISSSAKPNLYVRTLGPARAEEAVVFIHGFISSSAFWTETLFPNFSGRVKSCFRLIAVDLLGFGRSPKPSESLYTLREHLEMLETSVLDPHKLQSFHIVAHSLGCILALALAVKYPRSVKSLTLLAPVIIIL